MSERVDNLVNMLDAYVADGGHHCLLYTSDAADE